MSEPTEVRFARIADWIEARARDGGGSTTDLAALTLIAGATGIASRFLEVLKPTAVAMLAAIAWGFVELWLRGRGRSPRARAVRATLPPTVLVLVSMWMLWPIWTGERAGLLDQDNTVHVERARAFWQAVSHGRWPVWTNLMQGGEPLTDAYGWLGSFLPPLFRALTFGKITFERAYVWTLCSLHALAAVAVYTLGRRFTRRPFALLAGFLFIIGGHLAPFFAGDRSIWQLFLFMGLWHSFLSALIAMFATAKLVDVVRRGRLADAIWVTVLTLAASLCHGLGTISCVTLLGCTTIAGFLSPRAQARRTVFGAVAVVSGLLLAGFWVVPATSLLAENGLRFPRLPHAEDHSLLEFIGPISTATLLASGVATLIALFHRDRLLRGIAMAGLSTILLNETGVLSELGLADTNAGHAMQWHRLTVLFALVCTAPFAVMLQRAFVRAVPSPLAFRTLATRTIGLTVFFVLMLPPLGYTVGRGRHNLQTVDCYKFEDEPGFRLLESELIRLRRADPSKFRVHYSSQINLHATMALALRTGVPVTGMTHPPGLFMKNRPQIGDRDDVRAWGCKYLVVDAGTHVSENWVDGRVVGPYKIYRDDGFLGLARAKAPNVIAKVTRFEDDQIRVQVSGAPPGGTDVQLGVADYPRFRATLNGSPIAVKSAPAHAGGPPDQILVHVSDGEVILRPNMALPRAWAGRFATFLGLLLFAAMIASRRVPRFRDRLVRLRQLPDRYAHLVTTKRAAIASAVAIALSIVGVALPRGASTRPRVPVFFGAFDAVHRNNALCPQSVLTRRWYCGDQFGPPLGEVMHVVAAEVSPPPSLWGTGDQWSALRIAERDGKSSISVRFPNARVQRWIHVRMAPSGPWPVSLTLRVGNSPNALPVRIVHGWTTVDTGVTGTNSVTVEAGFVAIGAIDLALASDGSATTPPLPMQ